MQKILTKEYKANLNNHKTAYLNKFVACYVHYRTNTILTARAVKEKSNTWPTGASFTSDPKISLFR